MIKFEKDKILLLQQLLIEQTGGEDGVRDMGLLESLGVGLVSNHAFVDGNKRIGMYVLMAFLQINGVPFDASDDEIVRVGLSLAEGKMKYEELLAWIRENTK